MSLNRFVALAVVLALVAPPRAHAGVIWRCEPNTNHPDMQIECSDDPSAGGSCPEACACWDTCGGSTASGGNPQMNRALVNGLGAVFLVVFLFIIPGRALGWMGGDAGAPGLYKQKFQAVKQQIRADEELGRRAERDAAALRAQISAAEQAERERAAIRARVGWTPPKLVPSEQYQCDQAMMLLPYREGWPVGDIADWEQLRTQCGPYSLPNGHPITDGGVCEPETLECLGVCCPKDHPILNLCDNLCYASSDFRGAGEEKGLRCATYRDCAVHTP